MDSENKPSLKQIFGRGVVDSDVHKETQKLCSIYLGGIWNKIAAEDISVKIQSGGMNNFIFIVSLPENVKTVGDEPVVVMLRVYFSEDIRDAINESVVNAVLAERGLCPALYGAFAEGRIEEYIPSRIVTNKEFCNIHVGYEVGKILAAVHSLEMPIEKNDRFMRLTENMAIRLKSAPRWAKPHKMHTTLAEFHKQLCPEELSAELLYEELQVVKRCFERSGSPIVFSNNDLHEGNLLLRNGVRITENGILGCPKSMDPLVLIDYEYSSYYYRGFDVCHYCCECCQDNTNEKWPGYHIMQNQWPSEEHQRKFAEGYLDEADNIARKNGGRRPRCVSDLPIEREAAIQRLLMEIRQFVAFPHLMWGIWAFKQAEDFPSNPDYDFFEYGFDRLALYYKWKPEMLKYLES